MAEALISLGSNMGDRAQILRGALEALQALGDCKLVCASALYETKPWGYKDQDDFLNQACVLQTALKPLDLLDRMQEIERRFHRKRHFRYGPRTLDLDLIAYDEMKLESQRLTLPHPHASERAFVLVPLNEITPDSCLTHGGSSIRELLQALPQSALSEVEAYAQK